MFSSSVSRIFIKSSFCVYASFLTINSNQCFSDDIKNIEKKNIVIIGGGSAGIGCAALLRNDKVENITIIEPNNNHYYQPLWTLVGMGTKDVKESKRLLIDILPKGVDLIQQSAKTLNPDKNQIILSNGNVIEYDYLILAAGIQINWDIIPGLKDSIGKDGSGVVSVYDYNYATATEKAISEFKGGNAIFTLPITPVKCVGASQKIMWLFEEKLRVNNRDIRAKTNISYVVPGPVIFGVKKYADMLDDLAIERNINVQTKKLLIKIDSNNKIATFESKIDGKITEESYDLLHVTPPMFAPDFIKNSPFADGNGYVSVNKITLQSTKYPNTFAIGDCSSTPNSKTFAAISAQAPVVVHNIQKIMKNEEPNGKYNGYASCPLINSKNKLILAEFGYDGKILETFSHETGKFPYSLIGQTGYIPEIFFCWLKTTGFPFLYWNLWLKGRWYGANGIIKPDVTIDTINETKK